MTTRIRSIAAVLIGSAAVLVWTAKGGADPQPPARPRPGGHRPRRPCRRPRGRSYRT